MLFSRVIAFPESRRIFKIHLLATPFAALQMALFPMIPALLRKNFDAGQSQMTIATMCVPFLMILSLLWNEIYRRTRPSRYVLLLWFCAALPLSGIALAHGPVLVLVFFITAAAGYSAIQPINGDLLRSCYPPAARSTVYATLQSVNQATVMVVAYLIGLWLDHNENAFRYYIPLGVLLLAVAAVLMQRITRQPLFMERWQRPPTESLGRSMRRVLHNMVTVFREDPDFRRYEYAFMCYGVGWMICSVLIYFLVCDELLFDYSQIAFATQSTLQFTMLIMLIPVGLLMKKAGPIRLAGGSFAILILYPLGLIASTHVPADKALLMVTASTVVYGLGLTGVHLAWTIGPITLAKDASQAGHYLAIHAALVGVRALSQFPAMWLYKYLGDIRVPLLLASLSFLAGSILMLRLLRDIKLARRAAEVIESPPNKARHPSPSADMISEE